MNLPTNKHVFPEKQIKTGNKSPSAGKPFFLYNF